MLIIATEVSGVEGCLLEKFRPAKVISNKPGGIIGLLLCWISFSYVGLGDTSFQRETDYDADTY